VSRPSYQAHDPKGWCGDPRRGAAMGRPTIEGEPDYGGVLFVSRVELDGDYDVNGTYFGGGTPLFWYASEDGSIDQMERAPSLASAMKEAAKLYPRATVQIGETIDSGASDEDVKDDEDDEDDEDDDE
jgi:hypothetical protein